MPAEGTGIGQLGVLPGEPQPGSLEETACHTVVIGERPITIVAASIISRSWKAAPRYISWSIPDF